MLQSSRTTRPESHYSSVFPHLLGAPLAVLVEVLDADRGVQVLALALDIAQQVAVLLNALADLLSLSLQPLADEAHRANLSHVLNH